MRRATQEHGRKTLPVVISRICYHKIEVQHNQFIRLLASDRSQSFDWDEEGLPTHAADQLSQCEVRCVCHACPTCFVINSASEEAESDAPAAIAGTLVYGCTATLQHSSCKSGCAMHTLSHCLNRKNMQAPHITPVSASLPETDVSCLVTCKTKLSCQAWILFSPHHKPQVNHLWCKERKSTFPLYTENLQGTAVASILLFWTQEPHDSERLHTLPSISPSRT